MRMRLIVGMTGATGAALGVQLLRELREHDEVETHLVLSRWARATIDLETGLSVRDVTDLADVHYSPDEQGAAISSGSFRTDAMVIVPCSMKTLAGIRVGYADGLVARAADVVLKERRRLVLVPRETPLSEIPTRHRLPRGPAVGRHATRLSRAAVPVAPPKFVRDLSTSRLNGDVDNDSLHRPSRVPRSA
jgi:4-hydroxy-3-polyprenylbenzoate decarboxylase